MPISHALLDNRYDHYKALLRCQRFTGEGEDPQRSLDLDVVPIEVVGSGGSSSMS